MDNEEYLRIIENVRKQIKDDLLDGIDVKLEVMYNFKPVRLVWFIAKAELMLKQNIDLEEIYKSLEFKGLRLEKYNGIDDLCNIYIKMAKQRNDILDVNRNKWVQEKLNNNSSFNISKDLNNELEGNIKKCIEDFNSQKNITELALSYYQENNNVMYEIARAYSEKKGYTNTKVEFVQKITNMGYINSIIDCEEENVVVIIATNKNDYDDCTILMKILSNVGNKVYFIDLPMKVEVENIINVADTLQISIENSYIHESSTVIQPIDLINEGKSLGDNREYIIDYICNNYAKNNLVTILCSGKLIDELCQRPLLMKQMERLSPFYADYLEDHMNFGWVGNYLSYISKIYSFDVKKEIEKPAECKFSIVIPARNSAVSLRYTLKTCLNQRYQGSFEIVLSDNSTNGNTEVYDLYCELDDTRIKYYKTPGDLFLTKSFEFAFLMAKGEFIMSIGSDDALLPWTLEVLDDVIDKYPEEEIIQWERGFYAWPGFNGGQENQFVIPGNYEKNKYDLCKLSKSYYLVNILNDPNTMYGLPMFYINSGFRRNYFNTLIKKTGRLWDGTNQDIYMGIVNININEHIPYVKYPLAIAGMTGASVGLQSQKGITDEAQKLSNIGAHALSAIERLIPQVSTDISSMYINILRQIGRGLIPIGFLDSIIDFKQIFTQCFNQLQVTDVLYDQKLHFFRYTASMHGEEFLRWFDENIYNKAIIPIEVDDKKMDEFFKTKKYNEGNIETGGLILDAFKYGVTNVYEASLLFEKMTEL